MNNTSGTPQSILTTLRIAGIPHVPVTANIILPGAGAYHQHNDVNRGYFTGAPVLNADQRLLLAAYFFSDKNINENERVMCDGLERLDLNNDFSYFDFHLLPVVDYRININGDTVPSLDSLYGCRQHLPGRELCSNIQLADVAIHQFWQERVMNYQAAPVYSVANGNQNTTWEEHMLLVDNALYRVVFQTCPNIVANQRATIGAPTNRGGTNLAAHFKTNVVNLIATTLFKHTAAIVSTDPNIVRLSDMLDSNRREVQETYLMVTIPYAMKCCKVMNKHGIRMREILDANIRDKLLKDCYTRSEKFGVWSLEGLMPRLTATFAAGLGMGAIAPAAVVLPAGPPPAIAAFLLVPTAYRRTAQDRATCKGVYYEFLRLWLCVGRDNIPVEASKEHMTNLQKQLLNYAIQAEVGPPRPVGLAATLKILPPPPALGNVQALPPVPMRPLNLDRWATR